MNLVTSAVLELKHSQWTKNVQTSENIFSNPAETAPTQREAFIPFPERSRKVKRGKKDVAGGPVKCTFEGIKYAFDNPLLAELKLEESRGDRKSSWFQT